MHEHFDDALAARAAGDEAKAEGETEPQSESKSKSKSKPKAKSKSKTAAQPFPVGDYAQLLFGYAMLAEGSELPDPARFNQAVADLMEKSL
jgi:HSP90 family molecular chaperone